MMERRSHIIRPLMRRYLFLPFTLTLAACMMQEDRATPPKPQPQRPVVHAEIQTIDNIAPQAAVMQPPPVLADEAPAPKPLNPLQPEDIPVLSADDERVRAQLPFAPAIGMDPVDGTKISIRANTPMVELRSKIYYFVNEENKRLFVANPEQYIHGPFAKT
jgi:YHS domain-containing protein